MTMTGHPARSMRSYADAMKVLDFQLDQPSTRATMRDTGDKLVQCGLGSALADLQAGTIVRLLSLGSLVDAMQRRVNHGKVPIDELRLLRSRLSEESSAATSVLGKRWSWADAKAGWSPERRAAHEAALDNVGPRSWAEVDGWEARDRQRSRDNGKPGPVAATSR